VAEALLPFQQVGRLGPFPGSQDFVGRMRPFQREEMRMFHAALNEFHAQFGADRKRQKIMASVTVTQALSNALAGRVAKLDDGNGPAG